jgi:hypothetical protein
VVLDDGGGVYGTDAIMREEACGRASEERCRGRRKPVTVERAKSVMVPADQRVVMHAIEQILREQALYRQTSINRDTSTVTTIITPGFPLLSTKMIVHLRTEADQTKVEVLTRSQWYVLGDIFNMYNGYTDRFLQSLNTMLASP